VIFFFKAKNVLTIMIIAPQCIIAWDYLGTSRVYHYLNLQFSNL